MSTNSATAQAASVGIMPAFKRSIAIIAANHRSDPALKIYSADVRIADGEFAVQFIR